MTRAQEKVTDEAITGCLAEAAVLLAGFPVHVVYEAWVRGGDAA